MLLIVSPLLLGLQKQKPDLFRIMKGEGNIRGCLRLIKRNHSHATSPVDLLNRADSGEALRLLKRVPEEHQLSLEIHKGTCTAL